MRALASLLLTFVALGCANAQLPMQPVRDARAALAERGPVLDKGVAALDATATAEHELRDVLEIVCPAEPVALTPQQCDKATAAFNRLRDGTATLQGVGADLQTLLDQVDGALAFVELLGASP
jgi:hypothetical protein